MHNTGCPAERKPAVTVYKLADSRIAAQHVMTPHALNRSVLRAPVNAGLLAVERTT